MVDFAGQSESETFEDILLQLLKRSTRIEFHLDVIESTHARSGRATAKFEAAVCAYNGSKIIYDGTHSVGGRRSAHDAGPAATVRRDIESFWDYIFFLVESNGIESPPTIVLNGVSRSR
ncbi:hypothetical protein HED60_05655 [Planctomycetales bacterium ZRK34]|nr:hypothetical protein HED60_05655 [Planctomycetales bacterium ZRK34]